MIAPKPAGSLADLVASVEVPPVQQSFDALTWVKIAVVGALFIVLHAVQGQFKGLADVWISDPNWGHGWIIPLFSLYLLYSRRHELLTAPRRRCFWGLPIILAAVMCELLAFYPLGVTYLENLSMILLLFGLVLFLSGPQIIRLTWLPIWYLAFAMPLPQQLYSEIAFPLQNFAALSSAKILHVLGVGIVSTASALTVTSLSGHVHNLTVAEACSGIRSMMAYLALGVAFAYLTDRPLWQRVVLVGAILPVAILTNVLRVVITCTMFVIDRPELGTGFMHEFAGFVMFIPAALMLWGISAVMNRLFVDDQDDDEADDKPAAPDQARKDPSEEATV